MKTEMETVSSRPENGAAQPRVLIIGGGFAGLEAAKALADAPVRVTLIDRRNHHLFQPLLYQVATAALAPAQIAAPLRQILAGQRNTEVFLADAKHINLAHRKVVTDDLVFDYDYLIVATGARHSYFGHDDWEQHAPGLKQMDDALEIRQRFLAAFELAEKATDEAERAAALTFVVVGAGPTGVEMAGAIMEIARFSMTENFRRIDPSKARVVLLEGGPRVLPSFPEDLSESARRQLEKIGVQVQLNRKVTGVDAEGVLVDGERLAARTVIWAAGNVASPLLKSMGDGVQLDRAGRAIVNRDLSLTDRPEVLVLGDASNFSHQTGQPLPGTSPVAMQQGRHAAAVILDRLAGRESREFRYVDKGSMATIGRAKAVAQLFPTVFRRFHLSGLLAWFGWLFIHLMYLVGFRNKLGVLAEWGWAYLTHYRGSRLITRDVEALRKFSTAISVSKQPAQPPKS